MTRKSVVKKNAPKPKEISSPSSEDTPKDPDDLRIIRYEFTSIWDSPKTPGWHPVRKMRYVFWRMMSSCTITDAIREIHWHEMEFWNLIDLKRHGPFREEYKRAKMLQGRSLADSVQIIAEGRDRITRKHARVTKKIIDRAIKKIGRQKSDLARKLITAELLSDLRERDKIIITRNKLQIDAAKWIAEKVNPTEYASKSTVSLAGTDGEAGIPARPIAIQFIGRDGKAVEL